MAEIPINYLKYIDQDGTEKKVYPITVTDAVYDSDGNKLSNVLLGVLKDTDISNVQSDSTTTVPSSALLKATDDKIGDTSSLPGDAGNVVSAINQLNSDLGGAIISRTSNLSDFDNSLNSENFRILWALIDNISYISFDMSWIRLQFRVQPASVNYRWKYGQATIQPWKEL